MQSFLAWKATPILTQPSGELCEAQTHAGAWIALFRSNKTEPFGELLTLKAAQVMEINGRNGIWS